MEKPTIIEHGSFADASSYDITQHEYAGSDAESSPGFIELLFIKNPKKGKRGAVLHNWDGRVGSKVYEFATLEQAFKAWEKAWSAKESDQIIRSSDGFLKCWNYGYRNPWFYDRTEQEAAAEEMN